MRFWLLWTAKRSRAEDETQPAYGTLTPLPSRWFQSTRPARGATTDGFASSAANSFNPRAPRGARLVRSNCWRRCHNVSIHAPRAGRDVTTPVIETCNCQFQSTRPARGATSIGLVEVEFRMFQSTRPARGATPHVRHLRLRMRCFNPRAPRGARLDRELGASAESVSIHAPRAGRDLGSSTCSFAQEVSIHAPRAGRDGSDRDHVLTNHRSFNPRAPRGARRPLHLCCAPVPQFQSTRPARGATPESQS